MPDRHTLRRLGFGLAAGALLWFPGISRAEPSAWWVIPGTLKLGPGVNPERWAVREPFRLSLARNEYEGFQIAVRLKEGQDTRAEFRFELTERSGEEDDAALRVALYRETFLEVTRPTDEHSRPGRYPDPLIPVEGSVSLDPGLNVVYVEMYAPAGATPGLRQAALRVRIAGRPEETMPVSIRVRSFALPRISTLRTAFGLNYESIYEKEEVPPLAGERSSAIRPYYRLLARHRLSPIDLQAAPRFQPGETPRTDFSTCSEEWEYGFHELGFNTLRIPFDERWPVDTTSVPLFSSEYNRLVEAYLRQTAAYLRSHGWLDRAYIYISTVDEPTSADDYAKSREYYRLVKQSDPELRYRHGEQISFRQENLKYCDILDMNLLAFDRHQKQARALNGVELGWYTAVGPKGNYPNFFIDRPSLEARVLPIMNYYYQIPRLLYWCMTWWQEVDHPYLQPLTYSPTPELFANGDGSLIYPGKPQGLEEPASSLRLKAIRDGLEDYEYCRLLEERRGRPMVLETLRGLIADLTHFSRRPERWFRWRERLGDLLDHEEETHADREN